MDSCLHPTFRSVLFIQLFYIISWNMPCAQANSLGNETDQLALLKFKEGITDDPNLVLNSWNTSLSICSWYGITCGRRHQRVISLALKGQNLFGAISPYIGNLSFLGSLDLQGNRLTGQIPQEVGKLFRLQHVLLNNNLLESQIPATLTNISQLRTISLAKNNITGNIPPNIGSLIMLKVLILDSNNLVGEIPPSLGNISSLTNFSVSFNNLQGKVPASLGQLTRLTFLNFASNQLSGEIPPSLFNISSITNFLTGTNMFHGSLPYTIGLTLPNLRQFSFGGNKFSGSIPASLSNASLLKILNIPVNNFVGQVPTNLGNLRNIRWLDFSFNNLGGDAANDLAFLTSLRNCSQLQILGFGYNHFEGVLPSSIGNLSIQLEELYLGGNQITGTIPVALEKFINLNVLGMESNHFTGVLPSYFGKFSRLQGLNLFQNKLSGQIPSSIGNLSQLSKLYLLKNNFEGTIPPTIGNCHSLQTLHISENNLTGPIPPEIFFLPSLSQQLNLSFNSLTGSLPAEVGKLANVNLLDISENNMSGEIPSTIGGCQSLEYLYLQGNSIQGNIPSSLASLKGLRRLDLSRNGLTGQIPKDLQGIQFLEFLNISFNDLEGEVPTRGVFANSSAVSLIGNGKLCGGKQEFQLPKCPTTAHRKGKSLAFKLAILIPCVILGILLMSAFLVLLRNPRKGCLSETIPMGKFVMVTYKELCQATDQFSSTNLIGYGSFSSVYKGLMSQEQKLVAVKVLNLHKYGASKSFLSECKALRTIRHRNLVKILTYCSSLDNKGNDFKALVFEFMPNGSLDNWLHPDFESQNQSRRLNLLQRLNIAIDTSSALHYLHDQCDTPVVHCDLKPSNVLLDDDMVAHVSDFGLAKLLSTINDDSESRTSTTGLKGTIGYVAPEYGMGGEKSKDGDVYSYGILVLEMFSGKRPTDEMFKNGLTLQNFVKSALPGGLNQVLDPSLVHTISQETGTVAMNATEEDSDDQEIQEVNFNKHRNCTSVPPEVHKCLLTILEIGLACSVESPKERVTMGEVNRQLYLIKKAFLGS
ncbi:hypothetical protein K2173_018019 [Erythroxylum novogranatense]|uniref:non-specific serine/threonine protein kinase n=1 Tax=Erythroxylum novogranatense TaxID=1862640 RepID=A0AAV8TWN8_9ROSI|nr:hypothetical protein K2173_018019 [Erythroxylum novogranatense]